MIFTLSDNGVLNCIDFRTGKTFWQKKIRGTYLSSLLLVNDILFASNKNGETQLFKADSLFNHIGTNILPEPIYASIAPIDNKLFIRTTHTLWCISNN